MPELRNIEEMSFREASAELEGIVRDLEQGELELEDSLTRYARGVELLKSLKTRLAQAEQKVQVLLDASNETVQPQADAAAAPSELPF